MSDRLEAWFGTLLGGGLDHYWAVRRRGTGDASPSPRGGNGRDTDEKFPSRKRLSRSHGAPPLSAVTFSTFPCRCPLS